MSKSNTVILILCFLYGLSTSIRAQNLAKGIVINEVYIGSGASVGDQFIELYNPQTTTQYLDANMIVQFGSTGGTLSGKVLTGVVTAWKFPGTPGGHTLPLGSGKFAVIAANAKKTSGLDLSSMGYEAHASAGLGGTSNPNAVQLHILGMVSLLYQGLTPEPTADAIALTDGTDSVIADGITATSVIDGMQYDTELVAGHFPLSIDTFPTGGPYLKYGYSMERKRAGVTTHDSYNDFSLEYPTPGYEHSTPAPITVATLMPLNLGRFVDYVEYDTGTSGMTPARSHASYTVLQTGLSFNGDTGVSSVLDSIGDGDPSGIHDLHYSFTSAGDLQAYADSAFISDLIPAEIVAGITQMPKTWVDYFKLSAGENNSYPITSLNSTVTTSGVTASIKITITGKYAGIEQVKVPTGTYDSGYHLEISAAVSISAAGGLATGNFTSTQDNWLVPGIGIVKTNAPIAGTSIAGNSITTVGKEKEMTGAEGIAPATVAAIASTASSGICIYPNPASDAVTISLKKPAKQILLYATDGRMVRSYDISGSGDALLWINDLPNGYYITRISYSDGTTGSASMVVEH